MITLTTMQLIFAIIMIWTAGFAIGAVVVTRIAFKIQDRERTKEIVKEILDKE